MLYTVRIEPNKTFLRALMTNFFASSPEAHRHLAQIEAFHASAEGCRASHFKKLWSQAAKVGPLPSKTLQELSRQAQAAEARSYDSYFSRHWDKVAQSGPQPENVISKIVAQATREHQRDQNNARSLFFAHLVEFTRSLKIPAAKFAALPDNADTQMLKAAVKDHLGQIVRELQANTEIQDIILDKFTPAKMEKAAAASVPPSTVIEETPVPSIVPLMHEGLEVGIPFTPATEPAPQGLRLH